MANEVEIVVTAVYKPGGLQRARQEITQDAQRLGADVERHMDRAADSAGRAFADVAPKIGRDLDQVSVQAAQAGNKIEKELQKSGTAAGQGFADRLKAGFSDLDFGDIGQSLSSGLGGLAKAGGPLLGAATALAAAFGDDFMQGLSQGFTANRAAVTRSIRTGLDIDVVRGLGAEAGELYARGFGESLSGMKDAAATIEQNLRVIDASLDTETITRYASTFEAAFGIAIPEQTRLARRLIANELAPDTVAAFDLIGVAAQQFGDQMDEGLDVINEFSPTFRALGIDGASAVDLVTQAIQGGWFTTLDRAGDMWLELRNRIVASDDARATVEGLGLDFEELRAKMAAGGEVGEQALQQLVGALLNVKSDADLATIAVELFGANLEEVSNPRHAFEIIQQALALESVSGSAEEAAQALEGTASEWDKMSRHVSTGAAELGERLAGLFNFLADTSDWEETTARIEESTRKFKGLAEGAAELRAELEETGEIAKRGGGGVRYFADEVDAAADEVQELDAALSEFAGRFDSDRIFRSLADDIDKLAASTEKLTASSYDLATGFDTSTAAGRSAEAAAESLSGNLDVLAQKYINGEITAGQFRSGQAQVESALRSVAGQMGLNQAETAALIAKYAEVPSDIQTRADLDASPAWNEALRLKGQLDSLDGRVTTSSSNHYINTFKTTFYRADRQAAGGWGNAAGGAGIAAAAAGGIPAAAGGGLGIPTLVNERGDESARLPDGDVVSLPTGSTVFTAEDTASRFSGGSSGGSSGGPPVYNFHFHGGVITDRDIEAKFRDIVYRGGLDGLGGVN